MNTVKRKVAVAMSGGVDSSVAAYLMVQQKILDVVGIHMSNWDFHQEDPDRHLPECLEQEWKDAQAVARHLQMDVKHVSFTSDYWNHVFQPYCDGLSSGIMPNPDIDCNRYIKFGTLREYIRKRMGDHTLLATGHYARVWDPNLPGSFGDMPECLEKCLGEEPEIANFLNRGQSPILIAAADQSKDQSYFLCGVKQDTFRNVVFPLGDFYKKQDGAKNESTSSVPTVRDIAERANLPTATKRESMGICFIGKRTTFGKFMQQYISPSELHGSDKPEGRLISIDDGSVVDTFDLQARPNIVYSAIGQGAKISGASQKWFVAGKLSFAEILVCPGTHHPSLYSDSLSISSKDMNWLCNVNAGEVLSSDRTWSMRLKCRIRHLQPLVDCEIRHHEEKKDHFQVVFDKPLRGIAAGQTAAFYMGANGLICVGGGRIIESGPTYHERGVSLPSELHPAGLNDTSLRNYGRVQA